VIWRDLLLDDPVTPREKGSVNFSLRNSSAPSRSPRLRVVQTLGSQLSRSSYSGPYTPHVHCPILSLHPKITHLASFIPAAFELDRAIYDERSGRSVGEGFDLHAFGELVMEASEEYECGERAVDDETCCSAESASDSFGAEVEQALTFTMLYITTVSFIPVDAMSVESESREAKEVRWCR